MRKFLSCGLIAALAILPTALQVYAEPPPAEPVVVPTDCTAQQCPQPTK